MFYAEIDNNNMVKAILRTPKKITNQRMIIIQSYDQSVLGKKYIDNTFIRVAVPKSIITVEEFYDRIGFDKLTEMIASLSPGAKAFLKIVGSKKRINLENLEIIKGKNKLIELGVLTEQEAETIFKIEVVT